MVYPTLKLLGALGCAFLMSASLVAQDVAPADKVGEVKNADVKSAAEPAVKPGPFIDPQVKQAAGGCCTTPPLSGLGTYGGSGNSCVPGQAGCAPGGSHSIFGRLLNGFLGESCCADPCYEPRWIAAANAAFFQDSPRPITQTRVRWDSAINYNFPDAAEFFWAKIDGKGPKKATPNLRYGELNYFQEIATKGASAWVDMSYRSIESVTNPSSAGLGDVNIGVKTVMLDRELILVSTQIRTTVPAGNFTNGLGTGHVAIEPSLLSALKLTESAYLQTQLAYWIPLGGTPGFAGSTFHYHFSVNQNLYRHGDLLNVVGTVELNGYSFRGQYTDFATNKVLGLSGRGYVNIGPGLRIQLCERADIGVGAAFGLTDFGPEQLYRTEFRLRF